tara:strand:- start:3395 stop:3577 length:183 start_codon:yes stop_codon:yes gene_type:complete
MTPEERESLQDRYVSEVINDMDIDSLIQYASDALSHYLDKESDEDLVDLIHEIYPKLLTS